MHKIVYLGGYYQAEHSMQISFSEHGAELIFLIDDSVFGVNYLYDIIQTSYDKKVPFIKFIPRNKLKSFLEDYRPDIIIHRYYQTDPVMHEESYFVAQRLSIPFVILKMESTGQDQLRDGHYDCDFFLYTHGCDKDLYRGKSYFYPYGVSSFERSLNIPKTRNIGAFGYYRNFFDRVENLEMFLEGIVQAGEKLHVYDSPPEQEYSWDYYDGRFKDALIVHPVYKHKDTITEMNQYKIAINFETLYNTDTCSHKMFQSLGCGVPTLTFYRKSLEEMFGESGSVFVKTPEDVKDRVKMLLRDEPFRKKLGKKAEKFIHQNFDWFERFSAIMEKEKAW